jgi:hypothetical protein
MPVNLSPCPSPTRRGGSPHSLAGKGVGGLGGDETTRRCKGDRPVARTRATKRRPVNGASWKAGLIRRCNLARTLYVRALSTSTPSADVANVSGGTETDPGVTVTTICE